MVQAVKATRPRDVGGLLAGYDLRLIVIVLTLIGFGLVMLTSSSISLAERNFRDPFYYFWHQLPAVCLGLGAACFAMRLPLVLWERLALPALLLAVVLLILVLIPGIGHEVNGSMRWIRFGPIALQASEPLRPAVLFYLAAYLARRGAHMHSDFASFLVPLCVFTVICGLLLLEPDYGTAAVLAATALGLLFLAGVALSRFSLWALAVAGLLALFAILSPYRLKRLTSFLDPWQAPFDQGFQLTQALIAFGRGGWTGTGLGAGVQKLFYLPEAHTDFLFAVLAEELGFIGCVAVLGLFYLLVRRGYAIGLAAEAAGRHFAAFVAYGIVLLIGIQCTVNVGVNMGLLPTKGLPLPLLSYGANSMLITCFLLGVLLRVGYEVNGTRVRAGRGET